MAELERKTGNKKALMIQPKETYTKKQLLLHRPIPGNIEEPLATTDATQSITPAVKKTRNPNHSKLHDHDYSVYKFSRNEFQPNSPSLFQSHTSKRKTTMADTESTKTHTLLTNTNSKANALDITPTSISRDRANTQPRPKKTVKPKEINRCHYTVQEKSYPRMRPIQGYPLRSKNYHQPSMTLTRPIKKNHRQEAYHLLFIEPVIRGKFWPYVIPHQPVRFIPYQHHANYSLQRHYNKYEICPKKDLKGFINFWGRN